MNQRSGKKLTLRRERIRSLVPLGERALAQVAGGSGLSDPQAELGIAVSHCCRGR